VQRYIRLTWVPGALRVNEYGLIAKLRDGPVPHRDDVWKNNNEKAATAAAAAAAAAVAMVQWEQGMWRH
jgi:hypothetical protein